MRYLYPAWNAIGISEAISGASQVSGERLGPRGSPVKTG